MHIYITLHFSYYLQTGDSAIIHDTNGNVVFESKCDLIVEVEEVDVPPLSTYFCIVLSFFCSTNSNLFYPLSSQSMHT